MKRKLFSAILFGALLTASTSGLTSCKDYDDDISNLQSQIDKLATADQLSAKVSEMQAAISAAQSAAESKAANAQTVADAAKAAAADAAAAASKAQSTADGATQAAKDAAAAAAAADEVAKAAKAAVDKLAAEGHATKAELEEAAKAAQAYVDSVKKAIEETHAADKAAIEKAINDGLDAVKAEIAKTNEELAALAKRLDACEEKLAAIEAGEGQEEALKAIQEEVEDIADALEDIIGEYTSMVTDVDLYVSGDVDYDDLLRFVYVPQERDTKFPAAEGVADEQITFSSANKNVMTTDKLVVRVSPTNAVLNAANISLLNSQGADLSDYVEVKAVKPYEELIYGETTRAAEGNGLWEVEFKVKDGVDAAKFADAVTVKKGLTTYSIKYAVAVQNTESEETRRVISAYDVEVLPEDYEPATNDIEVTNRDGNLTNISDIRNRYKFNRIDKKGDIWASDAVIAYGEATELAWKNEPGVAGGSEPTVQDEGDNRYGKSFIDVEVGKSIDIFVGGVVNPINGTSDIVKGFYVVLDSQNAIESAPSEINAWESYSYTNVGVPGDSKRPAKMFYGNEGSISIDSPAALGDIIGFRVYVVNLDGTLVDPDGRAFYVNVATEKVVAKLTAEEMVAELHADGDDVEPYHWKAGKDNYYAVAALTAEAKAALAKAAGNSGWTITSNASAYGNNVIDVEDDDFTITYNEKANFKGSVEVSKIKYAKLIIKTPTHFLDEGTYAAQTTLYNANGTEICDLSITFKKTLPEYAPVLGWAPAYNPATQVFANKAQDDPSIYKIDPSATTPTAVEMTDLMKSLEYGSWEAGMSYYRLEFAKATEEGKSKYLPEKLNEWPATTTVGDNNKYKLTPDVEAIDGKSHDVVYGYDYGKISLTKNYQTAQYNEKNYWAYGKENLAMTFASWIHYEQVALAAAKTFTYRPGNAGEAVGSIVLVGAPGTSGSEQPAWSLSSDVVADLSGADLTYYKKVADGYYKFNKRAGLYVKPDGSNFFEVTEDAERIKANGVKLDMNTRDYYAKVVEVTGTNAVEYTVKVESGAKFYKKISNGDYYRVAYVAADNAWKFCKADGTTVYNNQTEQNVKDQNTTTPSNVTILADGILVNPVYVWTTTTVGGTAGTKSDLVAWNTVIRNYGADGKPIFGSEAVKKNFGELVGTYLKVESVETGDNDPFTAVKDGNTYKLVQKTGTLNPGNKGTLTIVIVDCFGIKQSRTVEYNIAQ